MECKIKTKNYKKVYDIISNIIGKTNSDNNKLENQIYKQMEILNEGNTFLQLLIHFNIFIKKFISEVKKIGFNIKLHII